MEPGFYRPDQGEQCRHMYYASCDRLESNIEDLPEDAVPDDLNFQPLDEDLPSGHLGKQMFVDWMQFDRHDCDVAKALGYSWTENLRGSGGETLGEFYDRLLIEREENEHGWPEAELDETTKTWRELCIMRPSVSFFCVPADGRQGVA